MIEKKQLQDLGGILLDADGVLWKDTQLLVDLPDIFSRLDEVGLAYGVVTNNSTRTPGHYVQKFRDLGVPLRDNQVINSALATAEYLKEKHPEGGLVYIIGEVGLVSTLESHGFRHVDPGAGSGVDVLAVVAGMDRELTYQKIAAGASLIRAGVPFIGTNPDQTYPTPEGLAPGAGTVLAALEAASGQPPEIMGKPRKGLFHTALRQLNCPPEKVLMVGDRLETDILGAKRAGCPAALVLTGVSTAEDAAAFQPPPDWIAQDLNAVVAHLEEVR